MKKSERNEGTICLIIMKNEDNEAKQKTMR